MILKYLDFAKNEFKDQLDDYIQSYINTKLPVEKKALFERLEEAPETNEAKTDHTTDVTDMITEHPLLVFATKWKYGGITPLHVTAKIGHTDTVNALLNKGADPTVTDSHGCTPLHYAVAHGHTNVAKYLLANWAEVNAKDEDGRTPLHLAALYGHTDIVKILQDAPDLNTKK